jgi:hypothetical protein
MKQSRLARAGVLLAALVIGGAAFTGIPEQVPEAKAIIGRPLTPMSYAGVARRTARRTAYGAAVVAPYAAYHGVAPIAVLPGGCMRTYAGGVAVYGCGGVYYRPYYDGPNLVYTTVPPP